MYFAQHEISLKTSRNQRKYTFFEILECIRLLSHEPRRSQRLRAPVAVSASRRVSPPIPAEAKLETPSAIQTTSGPSGCTRLH